MKINLNKEQAYHLVDVLEIANVEYLDESRYRLLSKAQKKEAIKFNEAIIKKLTKRLEER